MIDTISASLSQITEAMLSKHAVRHQAGSALEFSQTLMSLSNKYPDIWSTKLQGKTIPVLRIADLAKAGSQGASSEFWLNIARVCRSVPDNVLPTDQDEIEKFLSAVHTGVTRKDEPRTNLSDAWTCYISLCVRFSTNLDTEKQKAVLRDTVFPLVQQYLTPSAEGSRWNLPTNNASALVASILQNAALASVASSEWANVAEDLRKHIKTSAPEQSKDYAASQESVASQGSRLFSLAGTTLQHDVVSMEFREEIYRTTSDLLTECLNSIDSRQGKPYGAASVMESIVRNLGDSFFSHEALSRQVQDFVTNKLPDFIDSPSSSSLIAVLLLHRDQNVYPKAWNGALNATLNSVDSSRKTRDLQNLLSFPPSTTDNASTKNLQAYISRSVRSALAGQADWTSIARLLSGPSGNEQSSTTNSVLSEMMSGLSVQEQSMNAMSGLRTLATRNPQMVQQFLQGPHGPSLVQHLLLLSESEEEDLSKAASETSQTFQSTVTAGSPSLVPIATIIESGLYDVGKESLSVETLVGLARKHLETSGVTSLEQLEEVLPSSAKWASTLDTLLKSKPSEALAVTSQLGGAVYLVVTDENVQNTQISKDRDRRSGPLRMAVYVVSILRDPKLFFKLPEIRRAEIFRLLLLTTQLANDNISLGGSNPLWDNTSAPLATETLDFVSEAQALLKLWQRDANSYELVINALFQASQGHDAVAYNNARAHSYIVSEHLELQGAKSDADMEAKLRSTSRTQGSLAFAAYLTAYKTALAYTSTYNRICNELVADITGLKLSASVEDATRQLIHLNLMLQDQDQIVSSIAKQRLIFFVKHICDWLQDESSGPVITAETCKALTLLLPAMRDVYGDHWAIIIEFMVKLWENMPELNRKTASSSIVSLVHASLKMLVMLRKLVKDANSNDDLKDAWQDSVPKLSSGLMHILAQLGPVPDEDNQPLSIVNELLGRQIQVMPVSKLQNVQDVFPLMSAESRHVQNIAFELLHKHIPAQQEEISVNAALDKSVAHLPDELLSLILEAPDLDQVDDASFERIMPLALRSYLSSWLLIFDHFRNSSDKVKADYITHLKSGDYLLNFLNFFADFLGHSKGKPIDPSRHPAIAIETYSFEIEPSPIRDTYWLLCHLYYLSLKHLPNLTKSWWMDCKSRQTVLSIETWTEKHVSPLIITDALDTVTRWAATQDSVSEEEQLIIKPNQRTKEITVGKEIDEQLLSLVIRLPPTYPLGQATLAGLNRVAVDDKKWRSWLLNSQGVITFSNNSLIDGIIAFRRNVVGTLKGQTECAICYSVVGPDKQLPQKRCGTCKQLFHGSCLYRWFKSSNSSSCPLCRNAFNYS